MLGYSPDKTHGESCNLSFFVLNFIALNWASAVVAME